MPKFKWHTFRAVTDNEFIDEDMMKKLRDGTFASVFRDRRYRLLIGETENEVRIFFCVAQFSSKLTEISEAIPLFQGQCTRFQRGPTECVGKLLPLKCLSKSYTDGEVQAGE
jgi:hypothetical protein